MNVIELIEALEAKKSQYETAIQVLREVHERGLTVSPVNPNELRVCLQKPSLHVHIKDESAPLAKKDFAPNRISEEKSEDSRISVAAAVKLAATEPILRTSIELTDRVSEIVPHSTRANIQSAIWQLLKSGHLHKSEDLKIRPVVNGRPQ
jgi:hypothetical protein